MIDLDEINKEIDRLEHDAQTTYGNCERLAILHAVRDRYGTDAKSEPRAVQEYSYAAPASEFVSAYKAAPEAEALALIDEHMQAIRLLYPKEYDTIMRKLRAML